MAGMVGKQTFALGLIRVVELPDLDGAFVEIIEQASIDAHLTEIFPKGFPVGTASADWAVVDADHPVTPDIGGRLAGNANLVGREIGYTPCELTTKGAVTVCNPFGLAWQFDPHPAAVTASVDFHNDLYSPVRNVRNGSNATVRNCIRYFAGGCWPPEGSGTVT